jgi:hypothetical protein
MPDHLHHRKITTGRPVLLALMATLFAGSLLVPVRASAQSSPPAGNDQASPPAAAAPDISDQKISAAAAAIPKVENIRQNYEEQLAQAPETDRDRLTNQAKDEMTRAITDEGLSIPEYNSIIQAAAHDPQIRSRIMEHMPQSDQDHAPGP